MQARPARTPLPRLLQSSRSSTGLIPSLSLQSFPVVKNSAWVRNPIDNFVLARLEKEGLPPGAEADKEVLLRRVYLDLTGLPPSPKDTEAFLADKSSDAYEQVVDRLLASPHYGERWARPWLDLARYADSNGYEKDRPASRLGISRLGSFGP